MSEKTKEQVSVDIVDALKTQIVVNQALIDILISKGIFTREELMTQIQVIKQEMEAIETTN